MSCKALLKLAFASCIPVTPPITNITINPKAHTIGDRIAILPLHIVLSHENTLMPVGTATDIVATTKYLSVESDIPTVYMWWAHTVTLMSASTIIAVIILVFPNTGFLENFEISSLIAPKAGRIST